MGGQVETNPFMPSWNHPDQTDNWADAKKTEFEAEFRVYWDSPEAMEWIRDVIASQEEMRKQVVQMPPANRPAVVLRKNKPLSKLVEICEGIAKAIAPEMEKLTNEQLTDDRSACFWSTCWRRLDQHARAAVEKHFTSKRGSLEESEDDE